MLILEKVLKTMKAKEDLKAKEDQEEDDEDEVDEDEDDDDKEFFQHRLLPVCTVRSDARHCRGSLKLITVHENTPTQFTPCTRAHARGRERRRTYRCSHAKSMHRAYATWHIRMHN